MKRQEAIAYFQAKAEENPLDVEPHHNLAALYRSMGQVELYARHARIAQLTKDGGPKVWNEMGLALLAQNRLVEAMEQFDQVIQHWPSFPWAYVNKAALVARRGEYKEALTLSLKALQLAPQDPSVHRNLAKIYEALGKSGDAIGHYQYVLAAEPTDAETARRLALLSLSKGRSEDATMHYNLYRQLTGQHSDIKH